MTISRKSHAYDPTTHYNSSSYRSYTASSYTSAAATTTATTATSTSKADYAANLANQLLTQFFSPSDNKNLNVQNKTSEKPKETNTSESTTEKEEKTSVETEDIVKNILTKSGIDYDKETKEFQKDMVAKYEAITGVYPNISETELSRRLTNYAKGLQYRRQEQELVKAQLAGEDNSDAAIVDEDIKKALQDKDVEAYKKACLARGEAYIAANDSEDAGHKIGALDLHEFLASEFFNENYDVEVTDEASAKAKIAFDFFDIDGDGLWTKDEVAAFLWNSSKINDNENKTNTPDDITYAEYKATNEVMMIYQNAVLGLPEDKTQEFKKQLESGNRAEAMTILFKNANISQGDMVKLQAFIIGYENGYVGINGSSN